MAISQINVQSPSNEIIFTDTAIGSTAVGIKSASTLLYYVIVDNSANASPVYVKFFNVVSGSVVVGTTAPDYIMYIPGSSVITSTLFTSAAPGLTFGTALSAACVTSGGTAGTTAPSSSVILTVSYV